MKEIKAFVRPGEFDDMFAALKQNGFCCVTVTECEGTGKYSDPQYADLPSVKIPYMHSKVFKLEIVARDVDVDNIIKIIEKHGKTGRRGDGMIYVIEVERAVHIRTGNEGEDILIMNTNGNKNNLN
jgi:nitrogen regulatory protein P-II 1